MTPPDPRPAVGTLVRYMDPRTHSYRWGRVDSYATRGRHKGLARVVPVTGGRSLLVHPQALHTQGGPA